MSTVSSVGIQQILTSQLLNQQTTLNQLNEELGSGTKYDNLTDYTPSDANNLLNFQNAITQRQSYLTSMNTVQTRLSMYDTTMTDMEGIASDAGTLASQNSTLDTSKTAQIQATVQNYLKQMTEDLNQSVSGRYIYSGARYNVPPVKDLTTVTGTPSYPFTATTSPALPSYDSQYGTSNALTINTAPASTSAGFQVGSSTIKWSDLESGNVTKIYNSDGTTTNVTVTGLTTGGNLTPTQLANNLKTAINQLSGNSVGSFTGISATSSGATVSLAYSGIPAVITPDSGGATGEVSWSDGTDGINEETLGTTSTAAYTKDSVTVDDNYNIQYGVTSNDPGFQQVIAGLQLMNAATQQTDPATYQTDMDNASTLLSQGLTSIQTTHSQVANNINTMSSEATTQTTDINNLQNQIDGIQQVDLTTVGTELTLMQTQLQASYSATASLIQESILKYL